MIHLHTVASEIVIAPVEEVVWEVPHDFLWQGQQGLAMRQLCLGLDYWDPEVSFFTLVLLGTAWKCKVRVATKSPRIYIKDRGMPALKLAEGANQD
jgi:hypothetical protein